MNSTPAIGGVIAWVVLVAPPIIDVAWEIALEAHTINAGQTSNSDIIQILIPIHAG